MEESALQYCQRVIDLMNLKDPTLNIKMRLVHLKSKIIEMGALGITKQPETPEDLPKTITVITEDFIRLIGMCGSLCNPSAPLHYKEKMEIELAEIALRHKINYTGEIK